MLRKRLLPLSLILFALIFSTALLARESRIVGGDGIVGDTDLAASIGKIGLCPITASQDFGFQVAETANSAWPGAFGQSGAFKIVIVPDINPSALTPDDIIKLGQQYGVDALVWGSVDQARNRLSPWSTQNNPENDIAVMIGFKLYETRTGNLLWERTLKKDRTVSSYEAYGVMQRFAGNIVTDMVDYLIDDGIKGRDLGQNSPPVIVVPNPMISFRTSAIRIKGTVTDDFGVDEVAISCGGDEAIKLWSPESATQYQFDAVLTHEEVTSNSLVVRAKDLQGAETQLTLPVDFSATPIEGLTAGITGDSVFINIGSIAGVEPGMLFTVETTVQITDPATGAVLGSSKLRTGMIEVVSVEPEFSTCKVIDGKIEDMKAGDRVF